MYKPFTLGKRMIIIMLSLCLIFMGAVPTFAASKITLKSGAAAPITIYAGETYELKVAGVKVKFYSSDKSVATIGLITGELKAVAPGTVKITAKSTKTGKTVATKTFTVLQRAESITVDNSELYLNVSDTATIKATKTPATSTDVVSFASSDKTIAKVGATSGKVTAVKNGKCTITVYSKATKATANSSKNNKVTTVEVFVGPCIDQVIQKSTTELDITFKTFTEIKTSADLAIINDTTKATVAVKNVITDKENNKLVHVETFAEIKDGQTYTVSYKQTSARFTATAGQVADLQMVPTEIPYGSEETIYIQLLDANGIILGSYTKSNVPSNISIDKFEVSNGSYTTGDKMYLENKQSTGVVKAVYHTFKYENDQEVGKIEREQTITVIDSPEIKFEYTLNQGERPDFKAESYKQNTEVYYDEEEVAVHFYFTDSNGEEVQDYSKYRVSSSDNSKMFISGELDNVNKKVLLTFLDSTSSDTNYLVVSDHRGNVVATLPITVKEPNIELSQQPGVSLMTQGHGEVKADFTVTAEGTKVTLMAFPEQGYQFKEWKVLEGSAEIVDNSFILKDKAVTIQGVFEVISTQ